MTISEYEHFELATSEGPPCRLCGLPPFIDTPGLCVECSARIELARRLHAAGVSAQAAKYQAGLSVDAIEAEAATVDQVDERPDYAVGIDTVVQPMDEQTAALRELVLSRLPFGEIARRTGTDLDAVVRIADRLVAELDRSIMKSKRPGYRFMQELRVAW